MKRYDIFDLLKIILSFMVVAIHTELLPNILYPWLRLAVPLFFLISSYLLYTKIKNNPSENKKTIITNYIFRLLKMYLFWFIALIPFTIYVRRHWFDNGLTIGILNVILKPFMGSTFIASWYITASIIGTIIVDKLLSKVNYRILIVLFLIAYLICCCASSYSFLFQKISFLSSQKKYISIIEPNCSFIVSLIYILFGKIICEDKFRINRKTNLVLIILCSILLYIEWRIVWNLTEKNNYDCYLMIAPLCILFFNYIKSILHFYFFVKALLKM